jgi:hypothetical protein
MRAYQMTGQATHSIPPCFTVLLDYPDALITCSVVLLVTPPSCAKSLLDDVWNGCFMFLRMKPRVERGSSFHSAPLDKGPSHLLSTDEEVLIESLGVRSALSSSKKAD